MKAPKCPKCGKEHYSTQRCSAKGGDADRKCEDMASAGGSESDLPPPRKYEGRKSRKRDNGKAGTDRVVVDAGSRSVDDGAALTAEGSNAVSPLTPAEKQKAYRERLKDDPGAYEEYLEANKLRMRKKRDV